LKAGLALGAGLGLAALAGFIVFLFFRKRKGVDVESGSTALGDDVPEGDPSGKIVDISRNAFTGFTFRVRLDNPARAARSIKVALDFTPSGGFQFGVDPFHAEQLVDLKPRSSVELAMTDDDLSFAPIGGGQVTLSLDGKVADRQ